jgi:aerobic carbon-monoxide dehydrogenase large subunit
VGAPAFVGNLGSLAGVYRTPAIHADVTAVFTHTNPIRPYRGNGRPEAAFVIERMVDRAADRLGIDPAELRRRNTIPPAAMPFKTGLSFTYDSGEFAENMEMALRLADVDGFPARREEAKKRGKLRGLGISNTIERAGAPSYEGAEIRFDRGGTATLFTGAINQGQGHETVFKQIVCERLGLDPGDIQYLQGDTDQVFFGEGTGGSRSATLGGSAVAAASAKVVEKAREIAAFALKVDAKAVKFADGVFSAAATNATLTIKDVAKLAANPARLPVGIEPGLIATAVYRAEVENFPNGCHVCELEIDRDTGEVSIMRYSVVDDVGTVLNPMLLHGQIVGGIAQGIGQILKEDIHFDPASGQLETGSFMDYAMPRASDLAFVQIKSNSVPTKTNPLGVKGAGEAGTVGALPAVANALIDALSAFGVDHIEMPATPERIWRAMRQAG